MFEVEKKKEDGGEKRKEFNCAEENKAKGSRVQRPAAPTWALLGCKQRVGWRTKQSSSRGSTGALVCRATNQVSLYLFIYVLEGARENSQ